MGKELCNLIHEDGNYVYYGSVIYDDDVINIGDIITIDAQPGMFRSYRVAKIHIHKQEPNMIEITDSRGITWALEAILQYPYTIQHAQVLNVDSYAYLCNVDTRTVRAWIARGKLPQAQKFGRDWMIPNGTPRPEDRRYVENPIRNRRKEK